MTDHIAAIEYWLEILGAMLKPRIWHGQNIIFADRISAAMPSVEDAFKELRGNTLALIKQYAHDCGESIDMLEKIAFLEGALAEAMS